LKTGELRERERERRPLHRFPNRKPVALSNSVSSLVDDVKKEESFFGNELSLTLENRTKV